MGTMDGEKKTVQKHHQEIVKALGLYDDQATQEYVNLVGQRLAQASDLPNEEFKFFVIDDEAINAFTTGCCNVYINRGLLINVNSEAELAGVLGPRDRPHHRAPSGASPDAGHGRVARRHGGRHPHGLECHRAARQHRRGRPGCRATAARTKWKRIASA